MIGPSAGQHGEEPDYRFSLANERTFLAYVRTALAFLAAGSAVLGLFGHVDGHHTLVVVLGSGLYALGVFTAATCYHRWRALERAMRLNQPLPFSIIPPVMAVTIIVLAVVAFAAALLT